jgi:hypothetical protein
MEYAQMDGRTGDEPEHGMPTVEEVREWRKAHDERLSRRILVNPTGSGVADLFRMTEAEELYKAMGLL